MKKALSIIACSLLSTTYALDDIYKGVGLLSMKRAGVGAHVGTLGYGGHITYDLSRSWYLKAELNTASHDEEFDEDGVKYDGNLDFNSNGITLNLLPFRKAPLLDGFRITGGIYAVDNRVTIKATGDNNTNQIDIGSVTNVSLTSNDQLDGEVVFDSVAPYAGVGWDWMLGKKDGFTISLDAGVVFTGTPEVNLQGNASLESLVGATAIAEEQDNLREEFKDLDMYPVIKLSVGLRF